LTLPQRVLSARVERIPSPNGRVKLLVDGRPYPGLFMQNFEATAEGAKAFYKAGLYI